MGRADAAVLSFMDANDGVIKRAEALALGMPSSTLHDWVRKRRLKAVGRGVYVLPGVVKNERVLLSAATRALDAVVSHESAARLFGLDGLDPRRVSVSVPVRRSNRFLGVTVHQLTDLAPEHTASVGGLTATIPARTVLDLAAVLPSRMLASVLDQFVRRKLTDYGQVSELLESLARQGKPGVARLRSVLQPRLGGTFTTDSELETRLIGIMREAGLPLPTTQYRPSWLRRMNGRVDLSYEAERLVIEGDSQRWHGTPEAFQADRTRDNLAQLAGWLILRFTWEDITSRSGYVTSTIAQALSARRNSEIPELEH